MAGKKKQQPEVISITDSMGLLHNTFVSFITEAKLPLPNVIVVLELLLKEAIDQAMHAYIGE
jgi:hypothetical protein